MILRLACVLLGIFTVCYSGEQEASAKSEKGLLQKDLKVSSEEQLETSVNYVKDKKGQHLKFDFSLKLKSVSDPDLLFSHFKNQKLIIFYFSVKCMHCHKALPHIIKVADELEQDEVAVIAIAVKNNKEDDIRNFIRKNEMNLPLFHDNNKKFSSQYGTGRIPLILAINKNGEYVKYSRFEKNKTTDQILELFSKTDFAR